MPDKRLIALPAAAALGLALVAGGAGASGDVSAAALKHRASVRADPNGDIAFTKHKLKVKHGRVTIVMRNPKSSGMPHGIAVDGHGVDKEGKIVDAGRRSRVKVKLKKGKYTFYCPVPGHRAAGMKGKLIVK
jgi:plastocyanin